MITNPTPFIQFNQKFLDVGNFKLIKNFKYGPRYFCGDSIIKVNDNKTRIEYDRPAKDEDSINYTHFNTNNNNLNLFFEPRDPHQIFHCLIYNILMIVPLLDEFDNVDVYLTRSDYELLKVNKKTLNINDRMFMSYLNLILDKQINFIPIDLSSLKKQQYYVKNYIIIHVPERHGITKELLEVVQKKIKNLQPMAGISNKIYLSRSDKRYKRVPKNEHLFEQYFVSKGFTAIDLANYSIIDQIRIFQNAEIVVGWSGSSFSNIFFSYNDKILIDFTYLPNNDLYYGPIEERLLNTNQPGNLDTQMNRYNFDWSILSTVFNCTYMKINFENIDTCEEALPILENNKWLKKILSE